MNISKVSLTGIAFFVLLLAGASVSAQLKAVKSGELALLKGKYKVAVGAEMRDKVTDFLKREAPELVIVDSWRDADFSLGFWWGQEERATHGQPPIIAHPNSSSTVSAAGLTVTAVGGSGEMIRVWNSTRPAPIDPSAFARSAAPLAPAHIAMLRSFLKDFKKL